MDVTPLRPVLTPADEAERLESMRRHPAGRKLSHLCPTCGHNPSGSLGEPMLDPMEPVPAAL